MATKLEALAAYNEQNSTSFTLTGLATDLLRKALVDAWFHKKQIEMQEALAAETVDV